MDCEIPASARPARRRRAPRLHTLAALASLCAAFASSCARVAASAPARDAEAGRAHEVQVEKLALGSNGTATVSAVLTYRDGSKARCRFRLRYWRDRAGDLVMGPGTPAKACVVVR